MSRRFLTALALATVAGLALFGVPTSSGATFTSTSRHAVSTVTAAPDWTPPIVAVQTPGSVVKDIVTVVADASDAETGVGGVVLQYLAPGASTWVTLCTANAAPYSCSWNTRTVADGSYALRAVATDRAGYSTTSPTVTTTVANNLLVVLADPGSIVKGSPTLSATLYNGGSVSYSVTIQYAVSGTTTWRTLCTTTTAPYSCPWSTASATFTQGESYDLRAVATAGGTSTTSAVVGDVLVDNRAPSVTMLDPGSPLRGTVTLAATAGDAESAVSEVLVQAQRTGTSTWTTLCTLSTDPYSCRYDTTQLSDGTYAFRAVATDEAGNTTTSGTVGSRVVDNTVSAVSLEDPGAYLSGTVTLAATASSTAGVASVRIERSSAGTATWTPVCTDTAAPYTCSLDTRALPDGLYDFRAVLVDGGERTTVSATVSNRRVDNSPLRGYDVQTAGGGAIAGRLDAGDVIRLRYTDQVDPATLTAGWTGAPLAVSVRLRDGNLLGLGGRGDTLDVLRNGVPVHLGSVNLKQDYLKNNKTAVLNATMAASATTVNGKTVTLVTITLGSQASGSGLKTQSAASTMVWTPSATATDLTGRVASTAPTAELGVLDREF